MDGWRFPVFAALKRLLMVLLLPLALAMRLLARKVGLASSSRTVGYVQVHS
jgi:hypothetical protein